MNIYKKSIGLFLKEIAKKKLPIRIYFSKKNFFNIYI